jgi:hypothetical protein
MKNNRIGKLLLAVAGGAFALQVGIARAEEQQPYAKEQETRHVKTRSAEDCQADLMRDWNHRSTGATGVVKFRSSEETYADLVRDWDGPAQAGERRSATTRTVKAAYDDLMRNWGG